jgi:hypothetical protein
MRVWHKSLIKRLDGLRSRGINAAWMNKSHLAGKATSNDCPPVAFQNWNFDPVWTSHFQYIQSEFCQKNNFPAELCFVQQVLRNAFDGISSAIHLQTAKASQAIDIGGQFIQINIKVYSIMQIPPIRGVSFRCSAFVTLSRSKQIFTNAFPKYQFWDQYGTQGQSPLTVGFLNNP